MELDVTPGRPIFCSLSFRGHGVPRGFSRRWADAACLSAVRHVPGLGERHIRLAVKDAGANDRSLAITAEVLEILLLA